MCYTNLLLLTYLLTPPQGCGAPALPNFGGSLPFMSTPFNTDHVWQDNMDHCGVGVFLGSAPPPIPWRQSPGLPVLGTLLFMFTPFDLE